MKPSQIFDVLDLAQRARKNGHILNPCFAGAPGIGKSHIVQSWAKEKGLNLIDLRIAYLESPDLIGFPNIQLRDGRSVTIHNLPEFLPTSGEGVLLLEEPNRGVTSTMNCLMQLLTDRKLHTYSLPEGWFTVACINPEGDEYDVNRMDSALKNRLEIFDVEYDSRSFLAYMKKAKWHPDIINFVEAGFFKYKTPDEIGTIPGASYVSPRTLEKVNAALWAELPKNLEIDFYMSTLGTNLSKSFYAFRHNESPVMMADIRSDMKSALKRLAKFADPENYQGGMISLTIRDVVEKGTITNEELAKIVDVLPVESLQSLLVEIARKRIGTNISDLQKSISDLVTDINKLNPNFKKKYHELNEDQKA